MLEIRRYTEHDAEAWNSFVATSKNGTFLLDRRFMDYHKDRFADYSLMVMKDGKPLALLPANVKNGTLISHGGLTYGGLIMDSHMTAELCIQSFEAINRWLKDSCNINRIVYKPSPWIYHTLPAEEDLYAIIHVCHAQLTAREISTTVSLREGLKFSKLRRRCINKAIRQCINVKETLDYPSFWRILSSNLEEKYGVAPVHTIDEIKLLKDRFPERIRLFMAYDKETSLGGTLVFDCGSVVHTQYISASPRGKDEGALDLVFYYLINREFADRCYIDFGKSTEHEGQYLNTNLIHQKEGFGGRGVCYDTYEWTI